MHSAFGLFFSIFFKEPGFPLPQSIATGSGEIISEGSGYKPEPASKTTRQLPRGTVSLYLFVFKNSEAEASHYTSHYEFSILNGPITDKPRFAKEGQGRLLNIS